MREIAGRSAEQVWTLRGSAANLSMLRQEIIAAHLEDVVVDDVSAEVAGGTKLGSGVLATLIVSFLSGASLRGLDLLIEAARSRGKLDKHVEAPPLEGGHPDSQDGNGDSADAAE